MTKHEPKGFVLPAPVAPTSPLLFFTADYKLGNSRLGIFNSVQGFEAAVEEPLYGGHLNNVISTTSLRALPLGIRHQAVVELDFAYLALVMRMP